MTCSVCKILLRIRILKKWEFKAHGSLIILLIDKTVNIKKMYVTGFAIS